MTRALIEKLRAGDIRALARAITLVENEHPAADEVLEFARNHAGGAMIVGFTGAPGVGKSTLINAYIGYLRGTGKRVAVLSIDPSSPLSGGAILGDRLRMGEHVADPGVFIRSGASRGHLGGLCRNIGNIVLVMDANGWDVIVLETVGTGQSEIEIAETADVTVVVSTPGMGDDIQAMKSGVLEIADVLAVNKADMPDASRTVRQLRSMLQLREADRQAVPIVSTVATDGGGIEELAREIEAASSA